MSAITTLSTPLGSSAGPAAWRASWIQAAASRGDFAALYGSWVERLGAARREGTVATIRRLVGWLLLDAALLAAVAIAASSRADDVAAWARQGIGIGDALARVLVVMAAVVVAAPFAVGMVRSAHRLGETLAEVALPAAKEDRVDLADAPRRAFVVTLQIAILLPITLVLLALTQPFLAGPEGVLVVIGLAAVLAIAFWRSATNLQGHVWAGARVIVEVLAKQTRPGESSAAVTLEPVRSVLPGLGRPVALRLEATSPPWGGPSPNSTSAAERGPRCSRSSAARITSSCRPLRRYCAKETASRWPGRTTRWRRRVGC